MVIYEVQVFGIEEVFVVQVKLSLFFFGGIIFESNFFLIYRQGLFDSLLRRWFFGNEVRNKKL